MYALRVELVVRERSIWSKQIKVFRIHERQDQALHRAVRAVALDDGLKRRLHLILHRSAMASSRVFHTESISFWPIHRPCFMKAPNWYYSGISRHDQ